MHVDMLSPWFTRWVLELDPMYLNNCSIEVLQELVYLCYELNNARGFKIVTWRLVNPSWGHIKQHIPFSYIHLGLPERVASKCTFPQLNRTLIFPLIVSLNAARSNLRYQLHDRMYQIDIFLDSLCGCKEDSLFAYAFALRRTGV